MTIFLTETPRYNEIGLPLINNENVYLGDCFISWMGLWSLGFAIIAILLALGFSYWVDQKHRWFEKLFNKYLTPAFVVVWLFGFVVYDIGMYTGQPWSLLGNVPMAIIHAFEIFVLNSDVSAVHEPFHNNGWYMFGFSLAHFLAALVSLVFVLKYFGYNIVAAFRRMFVRSSRNTTYIFWGMNDATYYLAKDIKDRTDIDKDSRIVIVRTNNEGDSAIRMNGMDRLFNFLSLKNNDLDRLKELNCITANAYSNLAGLELEDCGTNEPVDILQKELRLNSLCRIIKKTTGTLHVFFLSDNDGENIQCVANLIKDTTIRSFTGRGKVNLYCHARYNSVHRVIEDEQQHENIEVKVVDSSHISIELLKKNPELHPVRYVNLENDATVSSPFLALVVGFGEVGLDAVRFLYEFGAFVKSGKGDVRRSEFHCHAFDKDLTDFAGLFKVNAPSIKTSVGNDKEDSNKMIHLHQMDCRSVEFYEMLSNMIGSLNYVVVATGDDEMNISLAVRILQQAIRNREDRLEHLRILVRVQHDEGGHIQKIANHYNRLWAAEKTVFNEGKKMHQHTISSSELIDTPITLFGSVSQVYTYNNVVREALKEDAKRFKRRYDLSINELRRKSGQEVYPLQSWDEERNDMMQLTGRYEGFAPTLSSIMRLRRVQYQNTANSLHKDTKLFMAKEAFGTDFDNIRYHGLTRAVGTTKYEWRDHSNLPLSHIQHVLDVLAQTEHLRWIASHEILGYTDKGAEDYKDEARLKHGCLKEWEDLTTKTQSYDYDVVDVSLGLIDIDIDQKE